jgi:hypothetical protein
VRGTSYGMFNLITGVALLLAGLIAGSVKYCRTKGYVFVGGRLRYLEANRLEMDHPVFVAVNG